MLIACLLKSSKLVKSTEGPGCLNCCFGFACLIILHVWRFKPSGKICSWDYLNSDDKKAAIEAFVDVYKNLPKMYHNSMQFMRGQYLLGLVIWVWCGGFFLCLVGCVCACIHKKKHG
jgi:hypothetical protein